MKSTCLLITAEFYDVIKINNNTKTKNQYVVETNDSI